MRLELTKQGDYAVRAMLALAAPGRRDLDAASTRISAEMAIPERVLPRVMRDLGAAGLVEARTGRSGGYRLARPAAEITLLDVIAAAEPNDDERRCVLRGIPCGRDGRCAVHDAFGEARSALLDRLARTTLAEVAAPRALTGQDRRPIRRGPDGPWRLAAVVRTIHVLFMYMFSAATRRSHDAPSAPPHRARGAARRHGGLRRHGSAHWTYAPATPPPAVAAAAVAPATSAAPAAPAAAATPVGTVDDRGLRPRVQAEGA